MTIFILLCSLLKSQCIDASLLSCIMLCYHRESYYTFKYFINKSEFFFKIISTRGCYTFGFMVVVG